MRVAKVKSVLLTGSFAVAWAFLAAGCEPSKGSLAGTVTLDGQPLKGGNVIFINKSGGSGATVEIGEDGKYSAPTLSAGDYVVTVATEYLNTSANSGGKVLGRPSMPSGMPMPSPGKGAVTGMPKENKDAKKFDLPEGYNPTMPGDNAKKYVKIPAKYANEAESGLTYKFTGGAQTYDIPLAGK